MIMILPSQRPQRWIARMPASATARALLMLSIHLQVPAKFGPDLCLTCVFLYRLTCASSARATFDPPSSSQSKTVMSLVIAIVTALAIALAVFSFFMWRRRQDRLQSMESSEDSSDSFLRMFSYMELKIANRDFRSKLGSGGFGSVFKGREQIGVQLKPR